MDLRRGIANKDIPRRSIATEGSNDDLDHFGKLTSFFAVANPYRSRLFEREIQLSLGQKWDEYVPRSWHSTCQNVNCHTLAESLITSELFPIPVGLQFAAADK